MRKILVYNIIALVSLFSVLLANYAMVFHFTANIITWLAVFFSLAPLFKVFFHPKGWAQKEKHFLSMWVGPLLYSMHKVISPLTIILLLLFQSQIEKFLSKDRSSEPENPPLKWRWHRAGFEVLCFTFTFLMLDIVREYTVWKELNVRWIPAFVFVLALLNMLYIHFNKRHKI